MAAETVEHFEQRTFGPYAVISEIGAGGMGVVYRAAHRETGNEVALKTVLGAGSDAIGHLRREIHAIRQLRHRGVVRILDDGVQRGVPWYAMELIDGRPLAQRMMTDLSDDLPTSIRSNQPAATILREAPQATGSLPADFPRLLSLMYRLCRVLAYIHGEGIVHRDLKPGNVIVRADDRPVLVDFGLVSRFRGAGREMLSVEGSVTGTLFYLAPEQARGDFVDARADLYAFGVMLYELVTGRRPFTSSTLYEMIVEQHAPPAPPSQWVPEVPHVLDQLILQLLQTDPADRYGYAEDVAQLLIEAGAEPDSEFDDVPPAAYLYRPQLKGRRPLIDALKQSIERARRGQGSFLLLGGESGIGKTSVASAVAREAAFDGFTVVTGECLPIAAGSAEREVIEAGPLHPLRPLLRAVADLSVQHKDVFDELLGQRIQTLREYEPALAALELQGDGERPRLAPDAMQRRLVGDVVNTLAAMTERVPLLLVLDDLQWADELTMKVLAALTPQFFASRRFVLLGLYRSEETTSALRALLERGDVARHEVGSLDDASIGAIAGAMLAAKKLPPGFVRFLARQSEGNPFFVAEYLLAAATALILYREGGRWRVRNADIDDENLSRILGLPESLRDLVGRRLEALSANARMVAEAAAVLGREFEERVLAEVAALDAGLLMDAVHELLDHRVLETTEAAARLRFAHDKLRDAAYDRMEAGGRGALHAAAARAIERNYGGEAELPLHYNELASHWEEAGEIDKAVDYYEKTAVLALRTGLSRRAAEVVRQMLDVHTTTDAVRLGYWYRLLSTALFGLGDVHGSSKAAAEGMQRLGEQLPSTRAGWMRAFAANVLEQIGHLLLTPRLFRANRAQWPRLAEAAHSATRLAESGIYAVDAVSMITCSLIAVNLAERCGAKPNVARAYAMLGLITGACGTPRIARRYFAQSVRSAANAGDLAAEAFAHLAASTYYVSTAQWERARQATEAGHHLSEATGDPQDKEIALTLFGHIEFYTGAVAEADATYVRVREAARARSNAQHMGWGHIGVARSLILEGALDEALAEADNGLRAAGNDHMITVIATSHAAMALLYRGELDRAAEQAEKAHALVSASMPTIFEMARAYSVPCEVFLAAWKRDADELLPTAWRWEEKVFRLCGGLRTLAQRFPILKPTHARLRGVALRQHGRQAAARRWLTRALAAAERLGLPVEAGLAHSELSRLSSLDGEARRKHAERAREIFQTAGARVYIDFTDFTESRMVTQRKLHPF